MNSLGHEKIAQVGLEILRESLKDRVANKSKITSKDLTAFILGNWITDACQLVDPVLFKNIFKEAAPAVEQVFDWIEEEIKKYDLTIEDIDVLNEKYHS